MDNTRPPLGRSLTPISRLLACLAACCVASATSRATTEDTQVWTSVAISGRLAAESRWLYAFDAHARFVDQAERLGVTILRPALGWRIDETFDAYAGYAQVDIDTGARDIEEQRVWQQLSFKAGSPFGGPLSGRARLEQRWREGADDTGHRFRLQMRWTHPVASTGLSFVAWNEIFLTLNDTDWGQVSGYDQNRAFLGLSYSLAREARLEGGYLYNHINGRAADHQNQVFSLSLALTP